MANLKPYYKLSDFPDRKGLGKNWMATCPLCDKKHLSISKDTGLYHCFSPDCDFNGQLDDFKPYPYQHNALGVRNCDTDVNLNVLKKDSAKDSSSKGRLEAYTAKRSVTPYEVRGGSDGGGSCLEGSTLQDLDSDFLPEDYATLEPSIIKQLKPIEHDSPVAKYLEEIHIPLEVAQAAGCMSATRTFNDRQRPCLCYVNRLYGKIINVKYRAVDAKLFTQDAQKAKDAPSAPYNIECLNPLKVYGSELMVNGENPIENPSENIGGDSLGGRHCVPQNPTENLTENPSINHKQLTINSLIITEGEKDCLTVLAAGYEQVISIPNGAGNKPETCFAPFMGWLQQVKRVIICGDQDKAGRVMKRNLKAFFEQMQIRVAIATMSSGCKDIADVNIKFGIEEVKRIIESAIFPLIPDIIRINQRRESFKRYFRGEYDKGYSIGYGPYTDKHLWLTDEGGLIIVTGRPNSGKTDWVRCTMTQLMAKLGKACAFLSFEEPQKEMHVRRIVELLIAQKHTERMPDEVQDQVLDFLQNRMIDIDMITMDSTTRNIIHIADLARQDGFPMSFLVIDPYLYVDMGNSKENETKLIKDMLTAFQSWGRRNHVWVVMVAHPRMLQKTGNGELEEIDEYTISGSAHWANLADYLISVKREFPNGREDTLSPDGRLIPPPSYTEVNVIKVRYQEFCLPGKLYFMRQNCGRYDERLSADACKAEIQKLPAQPGESRTIDTSFWFG